MREQKLRKRELAIRKEIRDLLTENPSIVIDELLQGFPFPPEVNPDETYFIREDDCDGQDSGIQINISSQGIRHGDAFISSSKFEVLKHFNSFGNSFCFRSPIGGSRFPMINRALIVLAFAIAQYGKKDPWGYYFDFQKEEKVFKK